MAVPDWLDWATSGSTVLAAGLAAYAVRQGARQTEAARLERRSDFELGILIELLNLMPKAVAADDEVIHMRDLARLLPEELIPTTRRAAGVGAAEVFGYMPGGTSGRAVNFSRNQFDVRAELVAAVERVLARRPQVPWYRRSITRAAGPVQGELS